MSCYVCKKNRGGEKCSRDDCTKRVCERCLGINVKYGGGVTGGDKWVTCAGKTQYYCSEHLIRSCVDCSVSCDGCTKCASKKARGAFRVSARCTICKLPFAKCGVCHEKDAGITANEKVKQCYKCREYFCKRSCGSEDFIDMYAMDEDLVPKCGRCLFWDSVD